MARLARVVIPGLPHHVTQRGNRREAIFFEDGDHGAPDLWTGWKRLSAAPSRAEPRAANQPAKITTS
jgi:hypothetical protein